VAGTRNAFECPPPKAAQDLDLAFLGMPSLMYPLFFRRFPFVAPLHLVPFLADFELVLMILPPGLNGLFPSNGFRSRCGTEWVHFNRIDFFSCFCTFFFDLFFRSPCLGSKEGTSFDPPLPVHPRPFFLMPPLCLRCHLVLRTRARLTTLPHYGRGPVFFQTGPSVFSFLKFSRCVFVRCLLSSPHVIFFGKLVFFFCFLCFVPPHLHRCFLFSASTFHDV